MPNPIRDMTGQRFGRLAVVALSHTKPCKGGSRIYWKCRCDCGEEIVVRGDSLRCGDHVSCGCKKIDQLSIHGMTKTPEFKAWCSMIERCHTETHQNFPLYGGTGISVCPEWRTNFLAFLQHIGPRPSSMYSIDRYPNNAGNYEPGNVRWATRKQQQRNMRSNVLTAKKVAEIRKIGMKMTLEALAKRFGGTPGNINHVLRYHTWR